MLLASLLKRLIRHGHLTVIDPDGKSHQFGTPGNRTSTVRIADWATLNRIFRNPRLGVGEAYMDGSLIIETGDTYDFLAIAMENIMKAPHSVFTPLYDGADRWYRWFQQYNPIGRSRRNVAHHYDLSSRLYDLFLDADRQYSCAYFAEAGDSLETAQARKKRHIAAKLLLAPGQKVLDIGCGWGGLGLYLAAESGADVTGLTLSTEQHGIANDRARRASLDGRARFLLRDYRHEQGSYDRIVSVGMFEHVGVQHYQTFFDKVAELLKENGVAVLHAIGRASGPGVTNAWIRKYVFPGGYCPSLSEVLPAIEKAGLYVTDIEILRQHYAETLKVWRERFLAHWDEVKALYDERFCRMWDFYLAACEASFRVQDMMVFQIQLAKRNDVVPVTRDYIAAWEQAHPLPKPVAPLRELPFAALEGLPFAPASLADPPLVTSGPALPPQAASSQAAPRPVERRTRT